MLRAIGHAVLLVAVVWLPGCLGHEPSGPPPVAAPLQAAPPGPLFALQKCVGYDYFGTYDDQSLRAQMPPGYRPHTVQGIAGSQVGLRTFTCDVSFANVTYGGIALAMTFVAVAPPEHATGNDAYLFEWILPTAKVAPLATWLSSHGWPVVDAVVTVAPGQVTVKGADVDYTVIDPAEAGGSGPIPSQGDSGVGRLHHGAGPAALLNEEYTLGAMSASAPAMVATKGVLARLAPAAAATGTTGLSFLGVTFDAVYDDQLSSGETPA